MAANHNLRMHACARVIPLPTHSTASHSHPTQHTTTTHTRRGLVVRRRRFPQLKHNPAARLLALLTVPLLWPFARLADLLVWRKVRAALGGRQKLIVSGGSALPKLLEQFYEAAGIPVVSGYGLSETSPGTTYGRLSNRCTRPFLPFCHNRHQQTTTTTTLNTSTTTISIYQNPNQSSPSAAPTATSSTAASWACLPRMWNCKSATSRRARRCPTASRALCSPGARK